MTDASLRSGSRSAQLGARRLRVEHLVTGGAVVARVVLIVLPLLSLLWGSIAGEAGFTLG